MALRKNGWCAVSGRNINVQEFCTVHNFRNRRRCLQQIAKLYADSIQNNKTYQIYESYTRINRHGDTVQSDIFIGMVKRSVSPGFRPNNGYYAIFEPSSEVGGYQYKRYYVTQRGNLIPIRN